MRSLAFSVLASLIVSSALAPGPARAQTASLVIDLTPGNGPRPYLGGRASDLRSAGGRLFFLAAEHHGEQTLWVSNGTSAGTQMLLDVCPPGCEGLALIGELRGLMLFRADGLLWRTDGTRPGTFPLAPIESVGADTTRETLGGWFYFPGCTARAQPPGGRDCDLWRTDGTVAELFESRAVAPGQLQRSGDRLYWLDGLGLAGLGRDRELWVTDGTPEGTRKLRGFTGPDGPRELTAASGRLFFTADEAGREVWTSDGTAAGTRQVRFGKLSRPVSELVAIGNSVYFVGDAEGDGGQIWRTNGTPSGTRRLTDLTASTTLPDRLTGMIAVAGDRVLFVARSSVGAGDLFVSSGSPDSVAPLLGSCESCRASALVTSGQLVFVLVATPGGRSALWTSDGSPAGTVRLADCGEAHCVPLLPWEAGVLFVRGSRVRGEVWQSDGTGAGTRRWARLPESFDGLTRVVRIGDTAYFTHGLGFVGGLWARDRAGSVNPVYLWGPSPESSLPVRMAALGDRVVFTARGENPGLWASTGSPASTVLLADLPTLAQNFVAAGGWLYFRVGYPGSFELWRTDGTPQGTRRIRRPYPDQSALVAHQGLVYFFDDRWIWWSDGVTGELTSAGILPAGHWVRSALSTPLGVFFDVESPTASEIWLLESPSAGPRKLFALDDDGFEERQLVFSSGQLYVGTLGLWRSDGTTSGSARVTLPGVLSSSRASGLLDLDGALLFFTRSAPGLVQLWRLDGDGPSALAEFPSDSEALPRLVALGGAAFFAASDGDHGTELWRTDGTADGTAMVVDGAPGWRSSSPTDLVAAGGSLYFAARDARHGDELWRTDGTGAGTELVHDLAPLGESSFPRQMTVAGARLYFTANDGLSGHEVWTLPVGGATPCQPTAIRLCIGRFAVEAAWRTRDDRYGTGRAIEVTNDTGAFWFFDEANVEVVVKILDGTAINGHVWVFYGALSDVEYSLTVTDTETGLSRRYHNPAGSLASAADTEAFGPLGAARSGATALAPPPQPQAVAVSHSAVAATGGCTAGAELLCLDGRFAVTVTWKDFTGRRGTGKAVDWTADTGWFWFFDDDNVELVLKVLDGRAVNGRHWVFYGALSSVEYTVTVTDTLTGARREYFNRAGRLASVADAWAFGQ